MRTRVSPKFRELAVKVGGLPFMKKILRPAYTWYINRVNMNRNRLFCEHGLEVLKEFDELMVSNNIIYSVFAGTLLGAVREKGFLKHDLDVDTVMFNKDYSLNTQRVLEDAGFDLIHCYLIDDGLKGREETYEKNGVSIDIFYVFEDKDFPTYQCDFHGEEGSSSHEDSMKKFGYVCSRRIEFPVSHNVIRIPFETIEVNAIENADEWLRCRYGDSYMTPDPSFRDKGDNPHIFEWKEVKAIMKF